MSIDVLKFAERIEMAVAQAPASSHSLVMEARDAILLAAALRLAEEIHESCSEIEMGGPRYHKFHGKRSPSVNVALAAYRAARGAKHSTGERSETEEATSDP